MTSEPGLEGYIRRSLSKDGGRTQHAEGTAEAKAASWRRRAQSWAGQPGIGCAEHPTPDVDMGEHQDQMVYNNILGSHQRSLTPRDCSEAFGALPPLPPHKDTPFGEVEVADGGDRSVILSPAPGSESPFPIRFQPRSAVKTEVGKLFFSSTWLQVGRMEANLSPQETALAVGSAP